MSPIGDSAHDLVGRKAEKSIEDMVDRLRRDTAEKAHQVGLPGYARKAVEAIDRSYFRGRKLWLVGPKRFHPEVQAFLPIILLDEACNHQRLRDKLAEYARYMTMNYVWVWCMAPVTMPLRLQARDLLLREGESGFGETPLAGAMAFIRYHHRMMNLDSLTDFGILYNRAYTLEMAGFFKGKDVEKTTYFEGFKEHPEEEEQKPEVHIQVPRGTRLGRAPQDETGEQPTADE